MRVYGPLYLCMDPPMGVVNGIHFLLWLWSGSGLESTIRWPCWDFRPGPSCIGGVALGFLAGGHHGESFGTGVERLEVSSHSLVVPSARKRVRASGNVGSSPSSLSMSNLTCFFLGFSLVGMGVSSHCALLLDSWGLCCRLRSFVE